MTPDRFIVLVNGTRPAIHDRETLRVAVFRFEENAREAAEKLNAGTMRPEFLRWS